MSATFDNLLEVQQRDTRIDQLAHRRANDPVRAERDAAEHAVAALDQQRDDVALQLAGVRSEQSRLELDVASIEEKSEKLNGSLYDGSVTAMKELQAIQSELATFAEHASAIEDRVLDCMERAEPLDAQLEEIAAARVAAVAALDGAEQAILAMEAEVDAEAERVETERGELAATLPAELMSEYEKVRGGAGGQGAARLATGGLCEGCHLSLPRADYAAIRSAPDDEIIHCPECNRILVR